MFIRLCLYLQETKKDMETIQIKLEKQLLDKALVYAKQRGVDLSAMLAPDDLNGRKAYQQYLEEKYR